ncbi:hypothetical protein ACWDA9_25300, partial [Streptomyces sp. NPDC001193]
VLAGPGRELVQVAPRGRGSGAAQGVLEAELSTGRVASTRGHKAIYIAVASGNLPEGHPYKLRGCIVKGSERKCTPWHAVRA